MDISAANGTDDAADAAPNTQSETKAAVSKTPLFQANHAARYQRQDMINKIQESTGSKLICYVAGKEAPVERDDTICFVDLLHNIDPGQPTDLLLHTGGGDIDAAEKLITMLRKQVGESRLRVIVPHMAKSAGTLIALGADIIIMSETSELGPIDPQIARTDRNGNRAWHSVKDYLDAYAEHKLVLKEDPENVAARIMLAKFDPETVRLYTNMLNRAREFAEQLLKHRMMSERGNWSQAVAALIDQEKFRTHGQPIGWEAASDQMIVGLTVDHRESSDPEWQMIWQLYCHQSLAAKDDEKLFESDVASLIV